MENDDVIMAGEDELARAGAAGLEGGEGDGPDTFELDLDGEVHTLPVALKGAFLRQADYTRKTQDLAEQRRAMDAERATLAQAARAHRSASADQIRLAALDDQLEDFRDVDWDAFAAQAPNEARVAWAAFQRMAEARGRLAYAVTHHGQRRELEAAREAAEAMAEAGRQLSREIEGWSPEVAAKLVEYALAFGVTREELAQAADPRLWKLLHKAQQADLAGREDAMARAPEVRPAITVAGGGAGGGGVRDALSTKEWMRRRNEQATRGR